MRYWIGNTEHIFLYKAQNRIRFVYEDDAQLENVWYPWLCVWVHIFGRCFYCGIRLYFVGKIHSQFYYGYVPCTQYSIHFVPIRRAFFLCKQTCLITKMFHSSSTKVFFYLSRSIHYTLWCWYRFLFTVLFKHEYIFKANNLQNALIALNSDLYMQFFLINTMIASIVIDDISTNFNKIMHRGN